jgi:glucose-6-phosphate 1-epimerase
MPKTSFREDELSRITFVPGQGNLPKLVIVTPWSTAEVYLHGAQITHFQKHGEEPLLFLSESSRFQTDSPIRGGIPICFPWFGARAGTEGQPMHGFARLKEWHVKEIVQNKNGEVTVTFHWSDALESDNFSVDYVVTVGKTLAAALNVKNESSNSDFTFEECLHTYFNVGDINQVSVSGLKGAFYLDKTANFSRKQEVPENIKISSEVDRTYLDTTSIVEIKDGALKRTIFVGKSNSKSTVVWNPWIERARQMSDLGDEDYKKMICVESGNVGEHKVTLAPGKSSSLKISLSSGPL